MLITFGGAAALALGLGSKQTVSQIIAGIYVRELYEVGDRITVGELEGSIEEIGTVKTSILTDDGQLVSIANNTLTSEKVSR